MQASHPIQKQGTAGTGAHLFPPVSKKAGVGSLVPVSPRTIRKPAHFSEDNRQVPNHVLGSLGHGDCGHSAPQEVLHRCVQVRSLTLLMSGDSDLDMDATDSSARHSLYDNIRSPYSVCLMKHLQHQQKR